MYYMYKFIIFVFLLELLILRWFLVFKVAHLRISNCIN